MNRAIAVLLAVVLPGPVLAQGIEVTPLFDDDVAVALPQISAQHVDIADDGVVLRALDRVSGEVVDFELGPQQTKQLGYIQVTLGECRYPTLNPSGDAYAFLQIREAGQAAPIFSGWMVSSSPALNALDHARYDVWVLRCKTSAGN